MDLKACYYPPVLYLCFFSWWKWKEDSLSDIFLSSVPSICCGVSVVVTAFLLMLAFTLNHFDFSFTCPTNSSFSSYCIWSGLFAGHRYTYIAFYIHHWKHIKIIISYKLSLTFLCGCELHGCSIGMNVWVNMYTSKKSKSISCLW